MVFWSHQFLKDAEYIYVIATVSQPNHHEEIITRSCPSVFERSPTLPSSLLVWTMRHHEPLKQLEVLFSRIEGTCQERKGEQPLIWNIDDLGIVQRKYRKYSM